MKYLKIILFLFTITSLEAQPSFEILIATEEDEVFFDAMEDNSGNVILTGRVGNRINPDYDPLLLKITPEGIYETKRFVFQDSVVMFNSTRMLTNGNYLIIGNYSLTEFYKWKYLYLAETDTNLNIIKHKNYKMIEENSFYNKCYYGRFTIVDQENNIYISGGKHETGRNGYNDMSFVKINQNLDTLLTKTHHFQFSQDVREFYPLPNSTQMQAIVQSMPLKGESPVILDSALNIVHVTNYINKPQFDVDVGNPLSSKHWLNDTTYLLSCLNITPYPESERRIAVLAIDTSVNLHNELYLDKVDTSDYPAWFNSMSYANDSTIYIGGFMNFLEFYPTHTNIVELYLIDKDLNLLGYYEYGGDANYDVWGILATSDQGCVVYGNRRTEEDTTQSDAYVFKVQREDFCITTEILKIDNPGQKVHVFPNPVKDYLYVKMDQSKTQSYYRLKIFTLSGKLITSKPIELSGNVLKVNVKPLKTGYYVYQLINEENSINGKFLKIN